MNFEISLRQLINGATKKKKICRKYFLSNFEVLKKKVEISLRCVAPIITYPGVIDKRRNATQRKKKNFSQILVKNLKC